MILSNRLKQETSPYLLQHAENPVDWYPWGREALEKAKREDKPIFLSIGYSTCHWCHVMAHESFEDQAVAELLNRSFISVKVDKEERPDLDSVYMAFCQAFTGSGGWPTTIIMTPEQKPFFAGTYFPKTSGRGHVGLMELLTVIARQWQEDRAALLSTAGQVVEALAHRETALRQEPQELLAKALAQFAASYDESWGGFGSAPKFPTPHNLLFLMKTYQRTGEKGALSMAEKTLTQMAAGGLFDHIGGGFCRYSTDRYFLAPHFEKMLCDNALLILAYCAAHELTGKGFYLRVAEETAAYVLRELTSPEGGFFSAQDADSGGEEGKYYLLRPEEVVAVLGQEDGKQFNQVFDITPSGNFEGKSIPNLLRSRRFDHGMENFMEPLRRYRRERCTLHRDEKLLTFWNCLMIAALCALYRTAKKPEYLTAAEAAWACVENRLTFGQDGLYASFCRGRPGAKGFLNDYAAAGFALISLYQATLQEKFLLRGKAFVRRAVRDFREEGGGFTLWGKENEALVLRPKETYDGALPSGNSLMAWDLVRLSALCPQEDWEKLLEEQLDFLTAEAASYPAGSAFFLTALWDHQKPPSHLTAVAPTQEELTDLPVQIPLDWTVRGLVAPAEGYPLLHGRTTYYLCRNQSCQPPTNELKI